MGRHRRLFAALVTILGIASACANTPASNPAPSASPTTPQADGRPHRTTPLPVQRAVGHSHLSAAQSASARASGVRETRLVLHDADLHFARGIGFHIQELTASAFPNRADTPLLLDDPTRFQLDAHQGTVVVSGRELSALLNAYTFNFKGAPLRDIKINTRGGKLHFAGQYNRHGWVNFSMAGDIALENDHVLKFSADAVRVAGRPAAALLAAAHVKLGDILDISANGVVLSGNTIRLKVLEMFPPPQLKLSIKKAEITDRGVVLTVDDGVDAPRIRPAVPDDSYIVIQGGDVKIMRTVVRGANLELLSQPPGQIVDLSLYNYRRQVAAGRVRLRLEPQEVFIVRVPALDTVTVGDAQ